MGLVCVLGFHYVFDNGSLRNLPLSSLPGITNYEEYSVIQELTEEKKEEGTGTLKKDRTLLRDERKMEKLKAKLHTDDDREWSGLSELWSIHAHLPSKRGVIYEYPGQS